MHSHWTIVYTLLNRWNTQDFQHVHKCKIYVSPHWCVSPHWFLQVWLPISQIWFKIFLSSFPPCFLLICTHLTLIYPTGNPVSSGEGERTVIYPLKGLVVMLVYQSITGNRQISNRWTRCWSVGGMVMAFVILCIHLSPNEITTYTGNSINYVRNTPKLTLLYSMSYHEVRQTLCTLHAHIYFSRSTFQEV